MTKPAEDRVAGEFNPAGRLIAIRSRGDDDPEFDALEEVAHGER